MNEILMIGKFTESDTGGRNVQLKGYLWKEGLMNGILVDGTLNEWDTGRRNV